MFDERAKADHDFVMYPTYYDGSRKVIQGKPTRDNMWIFLTTSTVYASGGNDVIEIHGSSNVIYGEAGDDFIGAYKDSFDSEIYGGKGNDTIRFNGNTAYAEGGDGDDIFFMLETLDEVTCVGGVGDDIFWMIESATVTLEGGTGNNIYRFDPYLINTSGVPYHNEVVITDFTNDDTIEYLYSAGNLFSNGSELDWYNDLRTGYVVIYDADYNFFSATLQGVTDINDVLGATYVSMRRTGTLGEIFSISGGDDKTSVNSAGTEIKILSGYDSDTFDATNRSALKVIDASDTTNDLEIIGNRLDNKIIGGIGNNTLIGGKGTDTLTGGAGKDLFIYNSDDGNDRITDYTAGEDKIQIASGDLTSATLNGNDVVLTVGKGKITVAGAKGKTLTLLDYHGSSTTTIVGGDDTTSGGGDTENKPGGNVDGGEEKISLTNYATSPYEIGDAVKIVDASSRTVGIQIGANGLNNSIVGGNGADKIYGRAGNDTIDGGAGNDSLFGGVGDDILSGGIGNDTLKGGGGNDQFVFTAGNDVVFDYVEGDDVIKISDTITDARAVNGNAVFTTSNGSLTVNGMANKTLTMMNSAGSTYSTVVSGGGDETLTLTNFATSPYEIGDAAKIVNASSRTKKIQIAGNSLNNSIVGGSANDIIYGRAGDDTLWGNGGNDSLFGGLGDDILSGGAGDDTLKGGDGADRFVYSAGLDVIFDYATEDVIKFAGTNYTSARAVNGDVVFTVGSGSLTVNNAVGKNLTVMDSTGSTRSITVS